MKFSKLAGLRGLFAAVVGTGLLWSWYSFVLVPKAIEDRASRNFHTVGVAVETYYVDTDLSHYPASLQDLIKAGYLQSLPLNPYSRETQPMPEVAIGQHAPGGITYVPKYRDGKAEPWGYLLIVYGTQRAGQGHGDREWSLTHGITVDQAKLIAWDYVLETHHELAGDYHEVKEKGF